MSSLFWLIHLYLTPGTPPRDNNNNNKNNKNNSNNKRNNSSPKHQKGNNGTSNHLSRTSELQLTSGNSIDRGSSPIQNLGVDSLGTVKAIAGREGMQDVVKKLSHEKKSSRQVILLIFLYLHFHCKSLNELLHLRCHSYLNERNDLSHTCTYAPFRQTKVNTII